MGNDVRGGAMTAFVAAGLCALLLACGACRRDDTKNAGGASNASASQSNAAPAAGNTQGGSDPSRLDAEIERLEKQAEKNPGNPELTAELARAYVRRGNALRDAGRVREALLDYQRAQSNDPDNDEATRNAADLAPQGEGTATGEYGEPAPLPITPNVTGGEEKPSPTPKKP